MTSQQLRSHPVVKRLHEIQQKLELKDIEFALQLRLRMHGSNWGKILAGTYTGRFDRALINLQVALDDYEHGASGETEDGIVVLDHVKQALDAVDIAIASEDEHRLVVIAGVRGSGKSRTLQLIHARHKGHLLSARPSWAGGYLNFLNRFAEGIGLSESRSAGAAESIIIDTLRDSTGVICIDEFNHFSPNAINFLKILLNDTRWVLVVSTIPFHLSRMASDRSTAQESAQLLRRAVAIIHIPAVTIRQIELIHRALYPHVHLNGGSQPLASIANHHHRLDSVCQILDDCDPADPTDLLKAIARHERFTKITLKPGEE
jgi:hypothetical protein